MKFKKYIMTLTVFGMLMSVFGSVGFGDNYNLEDIKVASQYRRVTDGVAMGRSMDDVVGILKETQTDFIFQGWMRQFPCPETCSDLPTEEQNKCEQEGYSYEHLKNAVSEIKKNMPDSIFCGGVLAEFLNPECRNPITGETFRRDKTWEMALDPSKWGISMSKEEFQTEWAISRDWTKKRDSYNSREQMHYYFPDLTNPKFQELFLSWAKKQIDSGADAIWIDMLYMQAELLKRNTGNVNHQSVDDSFKAASQIADEIHKYGKIKGKDIYVISWAQPIIAESPYRLNLDAVMTTPTANEVYSMNFDNKKWNTAVKLINGKLDNIVIFARIDYGKAGSPLSVFSQKFSIKEQKEFLKTADDFFQKKGIIFIYPIHGGNMGAYGGGSELLSFGKYDWYDSLAPEFQTYETIKELGLKKAGLEEKPICKSSCPYKDKCIPFGIRVKKNEKYCSINEILETQKQIDAKCQNNYECISNACVSGKCLDVEAQLGFLKKLWCKITNLFNDNNYKNCLIKGLN